jgi:hypothetical protein
LNCVADEQKKFWGLLRPGQCLVPTCRGGLALLLGLAMVAWVSVRTIYPFLATNHPYPGGVLVVEGWASSRALDYVVAEFGRNHYEKIYVTGGPVEIGTFMSNYPTYAERGAATLVGMGLGTNTVQAVPAPITRQDRIYTSAAALRNWWREHGVTPKGVNLISEGPHARRTRLFYRKALGKEVQVGVVALPGRDIDPKHWWRTSAGFRSVVDEFVGYLYAVLFFQTRGE